MIAAVPLNARNGTSRIRAFDRWFRYPAGFAPETLERCFEVARVGRGDLVVDPFAGVATCATFAMAQGLRFRGIEVHPLIAEVGTLKLTRPTITSTLLETAREIAD